MPRPLRLALMALAGLAFVAVSLGLARVLAAAGAERSVAIEVIEAQARGDAGRVVGLLDGCPASPACRAEVAARTRRLRRDGEVEVLRIDGPSRLALSGRTGTARVVWRGDPAAPTVQCVRLRRSGDVLRGFLVRALALSDPVALDRGCG